MTTRALLATGVVVADKDKLKRLTEFTLGWANVLNRLKGAFKSNEGIELSAEEVKFLLQGMRALAGPGRNT